MFISSPSLLCAASIAEKLISLKSRQAQKTSFLEITMLGNRDKRGGWKTVFLEIAINVEVGKRFPWKLR